MVKGKEEEATGPGPPETTQYQNYKIDEIERNHTC